MSEPSPPRRIDQEPDLGGRESQLDSIGHQDTSA